MSTKTWPNTFVVVVQVESQRGIDYDYQLEAYLARLLPAGSPVTIQTVVKASN